MDTLDWVTDKSAKTYHSADEIAEKILSFGERELYGANGAIILMHLGSERNDDYPHLKLPQIIQQFKARGYQFVTIPEML
jgi:peptidoglycan/xylan/chitin deacetylase (PgdA/CDA1 family)